MAISWDGAAWVALTAYAVSARAVNVGNVYAVTVAGTSAASGGPTGVTSPITDGTVTWNYLGPYNGCVTDVVPELTTATPAVTLDAQTLFLRMAEDQVLDLCIWQTVFRVDNARCYLAGHFAQLARLRGHGPLTSEHVGPLSRGYASMLDPHAYMLTTAGRGFQDCANNTPAIFGFV